MDFIEINKLTQRKKVLDAECTLYELNELNKDQATILVLQALRKQYGLNKTVKIIHGLGVDHL